MTTNGNSAAAEATAAASSTGGQLPVAIVGGGPIGLMTALGLAHYGVPFVLFEEDDALSSDTKAGTILTRTLEVMNRYGVLDDVLAGALRVDEIGELDRATNTRTLSVRTGDLTEDTRYPFVINIPQHELEPILRDRLAADLADTADTADSLRMAHRVTGFTDTGDQVTLNVTGPDGEYEFAASYLLACDGGRSAIRDALGITVEGKTLEERYMLVDLIVDLDVANPRDYPYLAYFGDPQEWMILVRQPHCWRFLFPLAQGRPEPGPEELRDKVIRFIGDTDQLELRGTNIYTVHHRVAHTWHVGRAFLMGDAAHLITPMWALGLNTGVLDASNLPWRLAWLLRGWAGPAVLDGYQAEQQPVAINGSGELAEAARANMGRRVDGLVAMGEGNWGNAYTRSLLGVSLDVEGTGDWSMVKSGDTPLPLRAGDRMPDLPIFTPTGRAYLHDLVADSFVALYFTDNRRRPRTLVRERAGLAQFFVSRWDAPLDSGLRGVSLFDPADRVRRRFGVAENTLVLVRPDAHVAAIVPFDPTDPTPVAEERYDHVVGTPDTVGTAGTAAVMAGEAGAATATVEEAAR